ncbi:hypothetical protein OPV22_018626 [Ensete ventricosum]|uniref:Uncharacterized protein n=1 Tax=Ensete ventricosum TaxID=4639 RepID=A0AAV8PJ86_ENSVE|nr:hypothetical protein OPV22_018626 [Ensete ventricosum]
MATARGRSTFVPLFSFRRKKKNGISYCCFGREGAIYSSKVFFRWAKIDRYRRSPNGNQTLHEAQVPFRHRGRFRDSQCCCRVFSCGWIELLEKNIYCK